MNRRAIGCVIFLGLVMLNDWRTAAFREAIAGTARDTIIVQALHGGVAAMVLVDSASVETTFIGSPDSTFETFTCFEPSTTLSFAGYELTHLDLHAGKAGSSHGAPSASLYLWRDGDAEPRRYACPRPWVGRDSIDVRCARTPVGDIRIAGRFVVRRFRETAGSMQTDIENFTLEALVSIVRRGRIVYAQRVTFIPCEGC